VAASVSDLQHGTGSSYLPPRILQCAGFEVLGAFRSKELLSQDGFLYPEPEPTFGLDSSRYISRFGLLDIPS